MARLGLEDGYNVNTNELRSGGQKMLSKHNTGHASLFTPRGWEGVGMGPQVDSI